MKHRNIISSWLDINEDVLKISEINLSKDDTREKIYNILAMIPYPSWAWMHLWHVMNYSAIDAIWRFKRFNWYKVLNPICWDSFWLPTENYAMKIWKKASEVTQINIENFKKQALSMNWWYDWNREFATSDPEYYKWTQWIFWELFKKWLVYRKKTYVNWCPKCNTALANDQVIDWKCERDETEVIQKLMPQWFIKITDYADRLIEDLKDLDWPEETKKHQINWIGRKDGYSLNFNTNVWNKLAVFIENLEDLNKCTWIKICPEHDILDILCTENNRIKLKEYRNNSIKKSNLEREHLSKDNTELDLWIKIINPINWNQIPLIIDEKILPTNWFWTALILWEQNKENEDKLPSSEELKNIIISNNYWESKVIYKLRDWSVSRQRYWGATIPVYYDENDNPNLINEEELPVLLPLDVENYKPDWKSPLENHQSFPVYEKNWIKYRRECDTLDTFVDSSFYYLRFLDPKNNDELISKDISDIIDNVDFYMWWKEHIVGHLLYARFIHKFLYDLWIVNTKEPFKKLFHQWMILAADWRKMSKRWWNVIDPMDIIKKYNHDVLKMWILFLGPLEATKSWDEAALKWIENFLNKINNFSCNTSFTDNPINEELSIINSWIIKITQDINNIAFNTAISKMMILFWEMQKLKSITKNTLNKFLIMLSVFAPDTAISIWNWIWNETKLLESSWPIADESKIEKKSINFPIQVNWKLKHTIEIEPWVSEDLIINKLKNDWIYEKLIWEKNIKKIIFRQDKIINFVI